MYMSLGIQQNDSDSLTINVVIFYLRLRRKNIKTFAGYHRYANAKAT